MNPNLTPEEASYLEGLLNNRKRGIRFLGITANLLLLFGGVLIAGTGFYLAQHMTDAAVYSVGLPNFIGGLLLIFGYIVLAKRVSHFRRLTSILLKLSGMKIPV